MQQYDACMRQGKYECVGIMQLRPDGLKHFEPKIQIPNTFVILNSALSCFALNSKLPCLNMHENSTDG